MSTPPPTAWSRSPKGRSPPTGRPGVPHPKQESGRPLQKKTSTPNRIPSEFIHARILLAVLTAALLLGTALPAAAHPNVSLDPTVPTDLTYKATDNIEHLGRFPEHTGAAGGTLSPDGKTFFITDPRGVFAYDTTTPETPKLRRFVPVYQHGSGTGAALAQEDPNTNGKILLVDGSSTPYGLPQLQVVDVSDPAKMKVLSSVAVTDHTWTCVSGPADAVTGEVNSCAYAYGRTGHIVDLTDPAAAKLLPNKWRTAVNCAQRLHPRPDGDPPGSGDELRLDRHPDGHPAPAAPVRLAAIEQKGRFPSLGYNSVVWRPRPVPGDGHRDRSLRLDQRRRQRLQERQLRHRDVGCTLHRDGGGQLPAGMPHAEAFADAAFTKVDSYDVSGRGLFLDGKAPHTSCTAPTGWSCTLTSPVAAW